jgi:glycosyltransferase involved in cell wall biosynthesis
VHTKQWGETFNPAVALFGRTVEAKLMPLAHRNNLIVTISPSTRAALEAIHISPDRIREIPQGCVMPPPICPKSETPLFVAVGRLVGYKRIDLLLEMWRSVSAVTGGKLVVIGDGPDRARLEGLKGEGVEFAGFVSDAEKHRLMCEAWVLLHPSSWEGWGLVITEAAVRGTPALGFRAPGVRDAIVDTETGLLASTNEDFERHWIRLAQDAPLRNRLGEAAMRQAQGVPWSTTVDVFEQIASEAMVRHRARSGDSSRAARYPSVDAV